LVLLIVLWTHNVSIFNVKNQHFTKWRKRKEIEVSRIHTSANPSDMFTKSLTGQLYNRHVNRLAGYYGPKSYNMSIQTPDYATPAPLGGLGNTRQSRVKFKLNPVANTQAPPESE
jgi:hypothetical protein